MNVLYCGMAYDIINPLLLIPDLDNLYAICLLDKAYGSWEEQKEDIKKVLTNGHDKFSRRYECHSSPRLENPSYEVFYLTEPSVILKDFDDGKRWVLDFIYNNKKRTLVYYHHMNFICEWPEEINSISHLISIGAPFILNGKILGKSLRERCLPDCLYYDQFAVTDNLVRVETGKFGGININPLFKAIKNYKQDSSSYSEEEMLSWIIDT